MGLWLTGSSWSETAHKVSRAITIFSSPCYPKEVKGWQFTLCMCQIPPRYGKPVQQGLSFVTWVPLASLCFPLAAVFPGALLGWDPVQQISQCNFPLTAPTTRQVRVHLRLPVFARFFHLTIETSVQKSSQSEEQENKSGSHVPEETNPGWLHLLPSSGPVKGWEHQS